MFFSVALQPKLCLGRLIVEVSRQHTIRHTHTHTHSVGLLSNEWSARRRGRYLLITQQTQQTNIHAISESTTCDPSSRVAAYLRLRSQGHSDRPKLLYSCADSSTIEGMGQEHRRKGESLWS